LPQELNIPKEISMPKIIHKFFFIISSILLYLFYRCNPQNAKMLH